MEFFLTVEETLTREENSLVKESITRLLCSSRTQDFSSSISYGVDKTIKVVVVRITPAASIPELLQGSRGLGPHCAYYQCQVTYVRS